MTERKIHYGSIQTPKYRVHIVFETPEGKLIEHLSESGTIDYARADWETFERLPEALRQEIVEELREIVIKERLQTARLAQQL